MIIEGIFFHVTFSSEFSGTFQHHRLTTRRNINQTLTNRFDMGHGFYSIHLAIEYDLCFRDEK